MALHQFKGLAACVHCHRRKVRCDARVVGFPCSNCRSSGQLDCRIHEKKKRMAVRSILNPVPIRCRPPPIGPPHPVPGSGLVPSATMPSQDLKRGLPMPGSGAGIGIGASPSNRHEGVTSSFQAVRSHVSSHAASGDLAPDRPHSLAVFRSQLEHARSGRPGAADASTDHSSHLDLEKRLVKLIDDEEEESGRREIQRGVRAIYLGHDGSNISFLIRQQRDMDGDDYHFAANEIPRRKLQTGHDQLLADALTLPDQALADELVEAYFAHINPGYPVVDEDLFMAQYRNRDPSDPPPILLLQAILLVGAHVAQLKPERDALKQIFFRRTKWLFDSRLERNRDIVVQAALLLTWHSDAVEDDVSANAHYWVGVAARIATGLGMHRNPVSRKFSPHDRRMWRRLWFILLQFDVMVSISHGRPQAM